LRPVVLGKPVRRIRSLMRDLDKVLVGHCEAKVAIETAMLDIVGKSTGLSIADLLGGRVRDTIPLSFSIADPDFAADMDRMRRMVSDGNRIYKVKTGVKSHREDLAHLEAIRSEFGDAIDLRLDYNQALEPFGCGMSRAFRRPSSSSRCGATTLPQWPPSWRPWIRPYWPTKAASTAGTSWRSSISRRPTQSRSS
jgi:hypothetical protein